MLADLIRPPPGSKLDSTDADEALKLEEELAISV